jgi:phosphohistidine phosphatase
MMLYVLRHSEAEETAPGGGGDEARRLTSRGREKMRAAAAGMRSLGVKFEALLTSPLTRAQETADVVAAAWANEPPPQMLPALASGVAPAEAVAALVPFARYNGVMIVGHEPQLSGLVSLLLSGSSDLVHLRLRKGGCVALEVANRFERGGAELHWMATQRQLRRKRK